jgi:hypothetical protein
MKGSLYYSMSKNPRGKAIIINNIYEDNDKNVGLKKESERFESILVEYIWGFWDTLISKNHLF